MALSAGTHLGPYKILNPLGTGGMGEVYRARDTRLDRSVAIKILPLHLAERVELRERFEREARAVSALNHPNICTLYDIGRQDGIEFIVMELLEGQTLSERLAEGPLPLGQVLRYAHEIADALDKAHRHGVVHRDLKPGNLMLTKAGSKLLDFGLAKLSTPAAFHPISGNEKVSAPATPASNLTAQGAMLGTLHYMSPEQLEGHDADPRSDIFSLGTLIYEMASGRKAFTAKSQAGVVAAILDKDPPPLSSVQPTVPPALDRAVRRCLEKDPEDRWQSARDLASELKWLADVEAQSAQLQATPVLEAVPESQTDRAGLGRWVPWVVAAVFLASTLYFAIGYYRPPPAPEMRVDLDTPPTSAPMEFALSPDGRSIAFVASDNGIQRLWLRELDKAEAQSIGGTDGGDFPFWSANGRSIGFFADGKLKRIDIAGGPAQALANVQTVRGGTWNADGTILFAPNSAAGIMRVSGSGGTPAAVTRLDPPRQNNHRFPQFLPDGRHFLFYATGTGEATGIYLASLDEGQPKLLVSSADSAASFLAPDMIVFARGSSLLAMHLDLKRSAVTGEPVKVADLADSSIIGYAGFSLSADGRIAYRSGGGSRHQLSWYDHSGKILGVAGSPDVSGLAYPELSPDGQKVAVSRTVQKKVDIWLLDFTRGAMTPFTFDPAINTAPLWSPDGTRVVFSSSRKGALNLYLKSSSGAGDDQLLLETPNPKTARDWSKDGHFLIYTESDEKTQQNLWALPVSGTDRKPFVIANTPFDESNGQLSPDGRWLAYETNESGNYEIVVQPFPEATGKWQISTKGGSQPRWSPDGRELYFIAADGKLTAVSIKAEGTKLGAGTPVALFPANLVAGAGTNKQQYAVSRDGRFLINQPVEESTATPITLILNWKPKAEK